MAFGTKQWNKPTPTSIERWFKIVAAISSFVIAWMQTVTFIPEKEDKILSGILGLIIGLCATLTPFFGVDTGQTQVPIGEVSAMDSTGGDRPPTPPKVP